jgi:high-affinity iron transporter
MFASALIVFREVLEATLIVSVVMAATRGMPHRGWWVSLGIATGVAGSALVAALTEIIATQFNGAGQDILNAAIMFIAVALIGWHVVWMNAHGREITANMRALGQSVTDGDRHMSVLAIVVGLAVMREGSEIVLMLQGLWATGSGTTLGGAALGLVAGIGVGALIYAGFVAMPVGRMFAATNVLLVLIAAGLAARGANALTQADLLPSLGNRLWDTSGALPDDGIIGQSLGALVGYIARPSGIEVLFYVATIAAVLALMFYADRVAAQRTLKAMAVPIFLLLGLCLLHPAPAHADALEVYSPYVVKGEFEVEGKGYVAHDRVADDSNAQAWVGEVGYSPTSFWKTELESEFERDAGSGQSPHYDSFGWENVFQLAEPGEYWIDPGFFVETEVTANDNDPSNIVFGFLGAKTMGRIEDTANLLLRKDYGPGNTALGFVYSNQMKYRLKPWLEPGFEIFGDTDGKEKFADQQLAIGPGIFGKIYTFNGQAVKYELGTIFGATPATPDAAVRWKLEYEMYF